MQGRSETPPWGSPTASAAVRRCSCSARASRSRQVLCWQALGARRSPAVQLLGQGDGQQHARRLRPDGLDHRGDVLPAPAPGAGAPGRMDPALLGVPGDQRDLRVHGSDRRGLGLSRPRPQGVDGLVPLLLAGLPRSGTSTTPAAEPGSRPAGAGTTSPRWCSPRQRVGC